MRATAPHASPWAVVMIGDDPAGSSSPTSFSTSTTRRRSGTLHGIMPGKAAWDWWSGQDGAGVEFKTGMNDATMKHYIDFASEMGLEYMLASPPLVHGARLRDNADTSADITKSIPAIDLPGSASTARAGVRHHPSGSIGSRARPDG